LTNILKSEDPLGHRKLFEPADAIHDFGSQLLPALPEVAPQIGKPRQLFMQLPLFRGLRGKQLFPLFQTLDRRQIDSAAFPKRSFPTPIRTGSARYLFSFSSSGPRTGPVDKPTGNAD
jgi:hypothetical protein